MALYAFRGEPFQHTHENRSFDDLLVALEQSVGGQDAVLLGNLYCSGAELDAVFLKRNAIVVVDFKNYGGIIRFSENGPWLAGDVEVKGGSKANPFVQLQGNKFALLNALKKILPLPSGRKPELGHIAAVAVFSQPVEFDRGCLPQKVASWFSVTDQARAVDTLLQVASREIDLSDEDLQAIPRAFGVASYTLPSARMRAATIASPQTPHAAVAACLSRAHESLTALLESSSRVVLVRGMEGTGTQDLMALCADGLKASGRSVSILAPSSRFVSSYPHNAKSVYSAIYSAKAEHNKNRLEHRIRENEDPENTVYLVGHAHLLSNSKREGEERVFGTGRLIDDLMAFTGAPGGMRRIVFFGDPFQLPRGGADGVPLSASPFGGSGDQPPQVIDLTELIPAAAKEVFVPILRAVAEGIGAKLYNRLSFEGGCESITPHESPASFQETLRHSFREHPFGTKYIVFSNSAAQAANRHIRSSVFGRPEQLAPGDVIHLYKSTRAEVLGVPGKRDYIPNGAFVIVAAVEDSVRPVIQPLKGRPGGPVLIEFLRIRGTWPGHEHEVGFLCLKDFLYSDDASPGTDLLLALYANARQRWREQRSNRESMDNSFFDIHEPLTSAEETSLIDFLEADSIFNAARAKFGYALTLHRAQGLTFDTVLADCDIGQGRTNENYFRWIYTLLTLPKHTLHLVNGPRITPFSKVRWDESRVRITAVDFPFPLDYEPNKDVPSGLFPSDFPVKERQLQNLFGEIDRRIKSSGIKVSVEAQHAWQLVCRFTGGKNEECLLRFHYDKSWRVTRCQTVRTCPQDFSDLVLRHLSRGPEARLPDGQVVLDAFHSLLSPSGLRIIQVRQHAYKLVLHLESTDLKPAARLEADYNSDGFVTHVVALEVVSEEIMDILRSLFIGGRK